MSIPPWTTEGVLPPVRPGADSASDDRSPYRIDLVSLVERFGISPARRRILDGLLRYRHELHSVGIQKGFQWLDGSFFEDIERLEERLPNDIDVVNFWDLRGIDQRALQQKCPSLFILEDVKREYFVDSFLVSLGRPLDRAIANRVAYWYSMWSHRRSGMWKGFVEVDLDPAQDADARAALMLCRGASHD